MGIYEDVKEVIVKRADAAVIAEYAEEKRQLEEMYARVLAVIRDTLVETAGHVTLEYWAQFNQQAVAWYLKADQLYDQSEKKLWDKCVKLLSDRDNIRVQDYDNLVWFGITVYKDV